MVTVDIQNINAAEVSKVKKSREDLHKVIGFLTNGCGCTLLDSQLHVDTRFTLHIYMHIRVIACTCSCSLHACTRKHF